MTSNEGRQRIRLAFVVTELTLGGAELMLWKLLSRLDRERYDPVVFSLSARSDQILDLFEAISVPCQLIGMAPNALGLGGLFRLAYKLKATQPDLVQGWLYHGNIAATIATCLSGRRPPVLWSIRGAPIHDQKRRSKAVVRLGAMLAFSATKIIYNSTASAAEHEQRLGYLPVKRLIIPNGFDTDAYAPSDGARAEMRSVLGLPDDALLIGLIARYDPVKDHENFLRAAALLSAKRPDVRYLLAGENVDATNNELRSLISKHHMTERVHLLGVRDDMPRLTAALDISVSASTVEGFPNVVGEAMSCGVPCVVTDVGDSAWLVGDTGETVPPRDALALATAMAKLVTIAKPERVALGRCARQRIIDNFSLDSIVRRYENLYSEIHSDARADKA